MSACVDLAVFHPLIHLSLCIHLPKGIEDAFKTAATEVSLLAGTDEFNATELFGVGKILPCLTPDYPSFRCSYAIKDSSSIWQQCSFTHLAFLVLRSITVQR